MFFSFGQQKANTQGSSDTRNEVGGLNDFVALMHEHFGQGFGIRDDQSLAVEYV